MKYLRLFLFVFIFLTTASSAAGQSEQADSVYVTCAGDPALPYIASPPKVQSPMADYGDISLSNGCIDDTMEGLKANLRDVGVQLIIGAPPATRPTTATIYFGLDIHGTPLAQLEDLTPDQFAAMPILYPHPTDAVYLWATSAQTREEDTTLFSAILLYSIGRCDLALPYLAEAEKHAAQYPSEDDEGNPDPSPIFPLSSFYEANCAVYSGDLQRAASLYRNQVLAIGTFYEPNTEVNLAWVDLQENEQQSAFQLLDKQINLAIKFYDPQDKTLPILLTKRSRFYTYTEQYNAALADLDQAIQIDPKYAESYYLRASLFIGDPAITDDPQMKALTDLQLYLSHTPTGLHAADAQREIETLEAQIGTPSP